VEGASTAVPASHLVTLTRPECLELLGSQVVGRLAFSRQALPDVVPVTFTFDGSHVLLRLDPVSAVCRAVRGAVVAFEVDDVDPDTRSGWSVTVVGEALEAEDQSDAAAPLAWAPGKRTCLLAIDTRQVTGRRILT
jgi:nitroimidazol reductase NimA-like FMN-containing flavoprotein (pyridoxamine 5'-phosphate oxidase superfamily)